MSLQTGDPLPDVVLYEGDPEGKVKLSNLFSGGKGVLFGVVGAFTPTCSRSHLPEFVSQHANLLSLGVSVVACVSVNDPYVLGCWGQAHGTDGKIIMLADPQGEFVRQAGLELDLTRTLGDVRCKRFAMITNDGIVTEAIIEEPEVKDQPSLAQLVVDKLNGSMAFQDASMDPSVDDAQSRSS